MLNKLRAILVNIKKKPGSKMILLTARRNFDNKELFLKTLESLVLILITLELKELVI